MHEVCTSTTNGSTVAHPVTENDRSGGNPGASRTRRDQSHGGQRVHGPSSLEISQTQRPEGVGHGTMPEQTGREDIRLARGRDLEARHIADKLREHGQRNRAGSFEP